ncbi:MAG: radical SAM protein [Clostridia bacterium]|nr:radical SAM protein [Clostridia bacterium]
MFNIQEYNSNSQNLKNFLKSYQLRHLHKDNTPMTISFLVTDRCNLRCKHCFNHKTRISDYEKAKEELTLDEYEKLSNSLGFFASALICGGEPFLREDLHEIIKLFRVNNNVQWCGNGTNGQLTDNIVKQVELICKQNTSRRYVLTFSMEGFEEQHDFTRGTGTFKRCMETWKEVKKLEAKYSNLRLATVSTMTSINQEILPDFFRWCAKEMQPAAMSVLLVRQSPRGGMQLKDVKAENYEKARATLNQLIKEGKNGAVNSPLAYIPSSYYYYITRTIKTGKRSFLCYAGKHGAYIDYNGEVNVCEVFGDPCCSDMPMTMGNLRDYNMDFIELWNSEQARKVKQFVNRHPVCESCTHETEGMLPSVYFEPNNFGIESMEKEKWSV